jgi:hypothetical protein
VKYYFIVPTVIDIGMSTTGTYSPPRHLFTCATPKTNVLHNLLARSNSKCVNLKGTAEMLKIRKNM